MCTIPKLPEFTISLKTKTRNAELFTVTSSEDMANVARKCFDGDTIEWVESFIVVALNRSSKVIGFYKVSQGGITGTIADPRVILQFALLSNATSLILMHNHPSGNTRPSEADMTLTKKIQTAASYLDIKVLDHLILTADSYYSFADEGMM